MLNIWAFTFFLLWPELSNVIFTFVVGCLCFVRCVKNVKLFFCVAHRCIPDSWVSNDTCQWIDNVSDVDRECCLIVHYAVISTLTHMELFHFTVNWWFRCWCWLQWTAECRHRVDAVVYMAMHSLCVMIFFFRWVANNRVSCKSSVLVWANLSCSKKTPKIDISY